MILILPLAVLLVALAFSAGVVVGRSALRPLAPAPVLPPVDGSGRRALWDYQRVLHDCGREIDAIVSGHVDPMTESSHEELLGARVRAYRHADLLDPAARWVVLTPSLPDLTDPAMDLVDVAHAYLTMAETLSGALRRTRSGPPTSADVRA